MIIVQEKGKRFSALHDGPDTFVIANAHDVGSARILAALGFPALATSSAAFANTLGRADYHITRTEKLAHCRALAEATDLPVSADLENCFAHDPEGVAETIGLAGGTGLVGGSVEDTTGDKARPIYDFAHAVERVAAAAEAARKLPFRFTLTARAENFLHGRRDIDDTIRRLQAFEKAGADVLYACGVTEMADIRAMVGALSKPVNVMAAKSLSVGELATAGVRRVSIAAWFGRAALGGLIAAAREVKERGTFGFIEGLPSGAEIATLLEKGKPT
ncbi:MAG: isocitrate lyase/phosphoenolpyruvate mutase family protein [Hyphomicrobiaceae bacterium]